MTPKRFFDTEGQPFPATVFDARSGTVTPKGNYALAEDSATTELLDDALFDNVEALRHRGEALLSMRKLAGAQDAFSAAIALLPEPKTMWNACAYLVVALGETFFRARDFEGARTALSDAMWAPGTIGNPWVHLRLGQAQFELGNLSRAGDELARAYMGGGREIFQDEDPKYFKYVETLLPPPPGHDRLP